MPKIYRVQSPGTTPKFVGSQSEAAKHRKYLNSELKVSRSAIDTAEIEYASGKAGVIEMLNKLETGRP